MVLPVVAQDGERVRDAIGRVLHLELDRVLAIVHLFVVPGLVDCQDALLSIHLFWVDREDHVVSDQGLFGLLAGLIKDTQVVPHFPELVLEGRCLSDVLERLIDLAHVV